jgi:peptide/nickel transport system ATP-binding protein
MVQAQVLQLLAQLRDELGLSMLFITHDLSVIVDVSDRLAVMYAGRLIEEGPAREVFADPAHPYTAALAAAFPTIGDERFVQAPTGLPGDPPDPRELPAGCTFHPRCPRAFDRCVEVDPPLYDVGDARRAACLLVEERAASEGGPG